jgi:hypothetical protein
MASTLEDLVTRLATRGLLPNEHSLTIWQHADGSGWGAAVEAIWPGAGVEGHGETLTGALEELMRNVNRGADLKDKS